MISKCQKTSTFAHLTRRQGRALPLLLSGRTVEEGCKHAGISKQTFYNWMKQRPSGRSIGERQSGFVALALETLKGNAMEAAEKLIGMISFRGGRPLAQRMQGRHRLQSEDQGARRDRDPPGRNWKNTSGRGAAGNEKDRLPRKEALPTVGSSVASPFFDN